MADLTSVLVNKTEKKILDSIRELPDGQLKGMVEQFLVEFTQMVVDPKCAEVQADGIPCSSPSADCEQCLRLKDLMQTLRGTLPQP